MRTGWVTAHHAELTGALESLRRDEPRLRRWGTELAEMLQRGGRMLAAGNGGSAAEAQHLTAELVGRFLTERRPLSAICLSAETSSLTAILNDYGAEEVFARQMHAHARAGDVAILLSTSGRSPNVVRAAHRARECGARVWAMTGRTPNPLADAADDCLAIDAPGCAAIQEAHLVAVHAICAALDDALELPLPDSAAQGRRTPNRLASGTPASARPIAPHNGHAPPSGVGRPSPETVEANR